MDEKSNIIDFSLAKDLARGGKGPPGKNWLADLEPTTVFICKKAGFPGQPPETMCMEYVVAKHLGKVTLLFTDLNPPASYVWVDTAVFSDNALCVEIGDSKKNVLD